MKWNTKDIELYVQSKEYIDTALIPLTGFTFQGGIKQSASANEFIHILANEIEKQFKGRVLLLPTLSYCDDWTREEKASLVNQWSKALEDERFKHVFFLTSDAEWKAMEEVFEDSLLWTAALPLEHLEEKYKKPMVEEQVNEVLHKIIQKWRKG
ncbi:MAG: YpiF family protein [Bacillus sp. (in: firmicutes)]